MGEMSQARAELPRSAPETSEGRRVEDPDPLPESSTEPSLQKAIGGVGKFLGDTGKRTGAFLGQTGKATGNLLSQTGKIFTGDAEGSSKGSTKGPARDL